MHSMGIPLSELLFGTLLSLNSIVSVIFNCFLIFFICVVDKRMLRKPINIYILSISVSDLVLAAIVTPLFAVTAFIRPHQISPIIQLFRSCKVIFLNFVLAEIACLNSIYTMVALAAERHRALVNPFKRPPFSIMHSFYTSIAIWLSSIIYGISLTVFLFDGFYHSPVTGNLIANPTPLPFFNETPITINIANQMDNFTNLLFNEDIYKKSELSSNLNKILATRMLREIRKQNDSLEDVKTIQPQHKDVYIWLLDNQTVRSASRLYEPGHFTIQALTPHHTSAYFFNNVSEGDLMATNAFLSIHDQLQGRDKTRARLQLTRKACQFKISELRPIYLIDVFVGYLIPLAVVAVLYGKIMATLTKHTTHRSPESASSSKRGSNEPIKIRISGGQGKPSSIRKHLNGSFKRIAQNKRRLSGPPTINYNRQNPSPMTFSKLSSNKNCNQKLNMQWDKDVTQSPVHDLAQYAINYSPVDPELYSPQKYDSKISGRFRSRFTFLIPHGASNMTIFRDGTSRQKRHAVLMILGIVILFALTWLPLHVVKLMEEFSPVDHFIHSRSARWLRKLCIFIAMTSTWANVVVYFYFNENYKRNFISFFRRRWPLTHKLLVRGRNVNDDMAHQYNHYFTGRKLTRHRKPLCFSTPKLNVIHRLMTKHPDKIDPKTLCPHNPEFPINYNRPTIQGQKYEGKYLRQSV